MSTISTPSDMVNKWLAEKRQKELTELKGTHAVSANPLAGQFVKGFSKSTLKVKQALGVKEVKIGITFRTDGGGEAHITHDQKAIECLNRMGEGLRLNGRQFPVVTAETLPKGAKGPNTPQRVAQYGDLDGIDLLYIPGAPSANDTQTGAKAADINEAREKDPGVAPVPPAQGATQQEIEQYETKKRGWETKKRKFIEHTSRAPYELKLIEIARTRGIPVLAICAGSWRLLESFGGQSRTIEVSIRGSHKKSQNPWDLKHDVKVTGNTNLSSAMGYQQKDGKLWPKMPTSQKDDDDYGKLLPRTDPQHTFKDANSTHWAAADVNSSGQLVKNPTQEVRDQKGRLQQRADIPSSLLQVSAIAPDGVVEAFETLFGAPCMGIQWHPEAYMPGMLGSEKNGKEQTETGLGIFEFMVFAAVASRLRRGFVAATLDMEKTAFQKLLTETKALLEAVGKMGSDEWQGRVGMCIKQAEALMPARALWSLRMDEMVEAMELTGDVSKRAQVADALKKHGVIV